MNWGMLYTWHSMLSIKSDRDMMGSQQTMTLRYPYSQKSQGFKSRDLGGQAIGKPLPNWRWSICFTQRAMWGGAPSHINTVAVLHRLA
ncbi:hypothetical protein TNCV_3260881 [Trichonephila clavipes]|nr:hypothetical protein TNCV_3260881 [Trichonephila clavipes]